MSVPVFERLHAQLQAAQIEFRVLHHEPVYTSEQAAAVRGASLASGAKALIVKLDTRFVMLVLPADRKLDSKAVKVGLGVKSIRFASKDEVLTLTGLEPGSIPPFGSLFGLPTYVDPALAEQATITFNAGAHAISVFMAHADYVRIEQPQPLVVTS